MTTMTAVLLLLKASLLLAASLASASLLRRSSAAGRHRAWSTLFVALITLPALSLLLPAVRVPLPSLPSRPIVATPATNEANTLRRNVDNATSVPARVQSTPSIAPTTNAIASAPRPSLRAIAVAVWIAGTLVGFCALLLSLIRVARIRQSGLTVDDRDWQDAVVRISGRLGLHRLVRLVRSPDVVTPMAGGVLSPIVLLPADALLWTAERREIVLAHEIAHIASRDPLRHLLSRVAFTLYWFHPLVWLAARKAANACEQACDELVLTLGVRPSTYARVLLDFADAPKSAVPALALPIVRPALLETRLMAILSTSPRSATRDRAVLPIAAAVALTLSVAAVQPLAVQPGVLAASATSVVHVVKHEPTIPAAPVIRPTQSTSVVRKTPVVAVSERAAPSETTCRWDRTDSPVCRHELSGLS